MDIIFIEGLVVMSTIGIYDWEQRISQKLLIDLELGCLNISRSCINDASSYLNYEDVVNFVCSLMRSRCFFLVESVAEELATELMLHFNIPWLRIKVCKSNILSQVNSVGITIERGNKE